MYKSNNSSFLSLHPSVSPHICILIKPQTCFVPSFDFQRFRSQQSQTCPEVDQSPAAASVIASPDTSSNLQADFSIKPRAINLPLLQTLTGWSNSFVDCWQLVQNPLNLKCSLCFFFLALF